MASKQTKKAKPEDLIRPLYLSEVKPIVVEPNLDQESDEIIASKYGKCDALIPLLRAVLKELVWARLERRIHG